MSDSLADLTRMTLAFRDERDWAQFHNPKDVAISLALEAAEVLELMQWRNGQALADHVADPAVKEMLADELSDVMHSVLLLAADNNIDLPAAFMAKMKKNELKYPAELVRSKAKKYSEYAQNLESQTAQPAPQAVTPPQEST